MTALEDWWAIERERPLPDAVIEARRNALRKTAFEGVTLPFTVDGLQITSIKVTDQRIEIMGLGDFSWPLHIYNSTVGVPTPTGDVVDIDGMRWSSDPRDVIAHGVRRVQR
mgnify:CR=1 FL=1